MEFKINKMDNNEQVGGMQHFYIYYRDNHHQVIFDRTCGTKEGANERVSFLLKRYPAAWWSERPSSVAFY
jgi:hypothetical protein